MAIQWLRGTWLLAAASALVLSSCGGGTIVSSFSPSRVVTFGDAMGDVGQTGARFTVNDGSDNNWTQFVATSFGLPTLLPISQGGNSYAIGNARVSTKPDAAGDSTTPTVAEQIDAFMAAGGPSGNDLIILSAGTADVIAEAQAVINGAQSLDQAVANTEQAGIALAAQVRRLVNAGATHVVVGGSYDMSRSPWATQVSQTDLLGQTSSRFNDKLLVSMVDLGATVLYIDVALEENLQTGNPASVGLTNVTVPACNSIDPGPGIGTGAGQVNSRLCTPSTIAAGVDYTTSLFADRVYLTPRGHQLLGDFAQSRIHDRW